MFKMATNTTKKTSIITLVVYAFAFIISLSWLYLFFYAAYAGTGILIFTLNKPEYFSTIEWLSFGVLPHIIALIVLIGSSINIVKLFKRLRASEASL